MSDIIKEEKKYLEYVKKCLSNEINYYENEMKEIPRRYTNVLQGDSFLVESLMSTASTTLNKLERAQSAPYFGRFDFLENGSTQVAKLYIGKTSIKGANSELVTIDWRTPVCSLYYDSEIGQTSYNAPKGLIQGELKLKRQIIIKDGELIDARDMSLVAQDELLQNYLNVHADNRMKNIIASIQKEQHHIISLPLNDNIVVQGVAGSGKTSVALHRIAYLVYNENKNINSDQFLVIGPNKYFLDYISNLLPDLEVDTISQMTFLDIAEDVIAEKINLSDLNLELETYFTTGNIDSSLIYKSSLKYKDVINNFISDYVLEQISNDIKIGDYTIITADILRKEYLDSGLNPIDGTFDKLQKRLINYIKNNEEEVYEKATSNLYTKVRKTDKNDPSRNEIYEEMAQLKKEIKTGCKKLLTNYFRKLKSKPLSIYKAFITNSEQYINDSEKLDINKFKKTTLRDISKKTLSYEDLPALMHIKLRFHGNDEYKKYRQIVLDEAQDLGIFHFYILKELFKNGSFSIFGDLNQAIHSYRSISSWEELNEKVFESSSNIKTLDKSYRTTSEIMTDANYIPEKLNLHVSDSLVRHGNDVEYYNTENIEKIDVILDKLTQFIKKEYKSIAIICKTDEEARIIAEKLRYNGVPVNYISGKDDKYLGGICTLTAYNSKGLEFDSVIITDASEQSYSSEQKLDLQILYVAMTRPLHELTVLYDKDITSVLKNCIKKNTTKDVLKLTKNK